MKRSIAAVATLTAICSLPLSAAEINLNEHYSLEEVHRLEISQKELSPITIGINIVPVSTSIATYPGNDLLVSIEGSSFLGTTKAPIIQSEVHSGILSLDIGYRSPFKAGLRVGNIKIEILIPESYSGSLQLQEMKSPTEIGTIRLDNFSAFMRNSRLTIRELHARRIKLVSKGRAKTDCRRVHAEQWQVKCGSGAFIAEEISGRMELESFDGKTDVAFSRFEGRCSLRSGGGNITVRLPGNSNLEMNLVSKTKTARCEFDLIGENSRQNPGQKVGFVGTASNNYLEAQSQFGKISVLSTPRRTAPANAHE